MASFTSAGSSFTLKVQIGLKPSGLPDIKSMTLSGVDAGATADQMYTVGNAIGAVLAYSLTDMVKNDKDLVVA